MSSRHKKGHKAIKELLFYIITPLVFSLIFYSVLFFALSPITAKYADIVNMLLPEKSDVKASRNLVNALDKASEPLLNNVDTDSVGNDMENKINFADIDFPSYGSRFGYIAVENTDVYCELYFGDNEEQLDSGAGVSFSSRIPGDNGVSLIAGHCASYFSTLGGASVGDSIFIQTNYGNYKYIITDIRILKATDKSAYDLSKKDNSIILYTCYPFNTLFTVNERYFVYAEYVSGPIIER